MSHEHDPAALEEVRSKVEKAYAAWLKYRRFTQQQVDAVVEKLAATGKVHARRLAELAVRETTYGNVEDKTAKNLLSSEWLPRAMRGMKTVGLLREIPEQQIVEYGVPVGVVAAIVPTTNPTSTVLYKTLIALKAGNAIVISPHPHAKKCTCETAELLHRAALEAGAPEDIIQCLTNPTIEATQALMRHERTAVILATGGHGMVRAAYSSGKPAFGVGPGNVAVLLDRSADVPEAVAKVIQGKTFDHGTVCSSEQSLVAEESLKDAIVSALKDGKAYFCRDREKEALAKLLVTPTWTINPKCVGQPVAKIAEMAGFSVPADTSIIVAELEGVGRQHPLSMEKLSPVLSLYFVKDFAAALDTCEAILRFGGLGHTCVIHARDEARIREFALRMPAMRVLVNTPAPQGSVGITTNVFPAMTLGCGAAAGNSTGDNVGPQHLINVKRLAYAVRQPEEAFQVPRATAAAGLEPQYIAAEVVDRFLASRRRPARVLPMQQPAPAQEPACNCPVPEQPSPPSPAPEVSVVDFVCENDVRTAMQHSRKIFIGPKTIVTPAARELADQHDVLVMAQRK
jgi:acetaldehyde dehydrogenase (acetylating)